MHILRSLLVCSAMALAASTPPSPARADTAAWRPFNLGVHHRRVSTSVPGAQRAFDQGIIWAYAFNHDEAIRAFQEAARLDPKLAMAWWGIALVNGPHINNPMVDEAHAKTAWEALAEANKRLEGASPVEKALIKALGARYAMPQPPDRHALDEAYATAMAAVFKRFPKDADVAVLYAESLMDVRPWDQWTKTGEPQPGTKEILAAIRAGLKLNPRHPGGLHLTIHALEASPHPERALAAANALRNLVPDSSHLVHMPGHIDARIGRWKDAATANEVAMKADGRYKARTPEIGFYGLYMLHNSHFLAYTAMMEGRKSVALEQTKAIVGTFPLTWVKENAIFADAFQTVHWEAMKRFGMWDELLQEPAPDAGLPVSTTYWHAARATAFAALGKVDEALAEEKAFTEALTKVPAEFSWGSNKAREVLKVTEAYVAGEIAYRQGKSEEAIAQLTEAVRREDALKYDEPPPCTVPSRHALGAVLLATGKAQEAEAVYRADLVYYPANGWSLLGLQRALAAQGKSAQAKAMEIRMKKAWVRSDIQAKSSCLCVDGM